MDIKNENDCYSFLRTEDKWNLKEKNVDLLTANVNSLCYSLSYIIAADLIENNAKDLTIYGLDNPLSTITVTTDNQHIFKLGELAPTGNYYYFLYDTNVYTITKYNGDVFLKSLNDYRSMSVVNIKTDDVRGINISGTDENLSVSYSPLPENQSNTFGSLSVWKMTSPVTYDVENEKFIKKILEPACNITAENIVEDNPTNLTKYNFNRNVEIILYNKTLSYLIGTSNGVNYVYPKDSSIVYAVSNINLAFLDIKAIDILQRFLVFEMLTDIKSIDIDMPTAKGILQVKRDNSESYYLDNNIQLSEGAFKSMFQVLIGLDADGFITKKITKSQLLGTITYHYVNGNTKTIKFYPYDEINATAEVDGTAIFYIKKTKVLDLENYLNALRANPNKRVKER